MTLHSLIPSRTGLAILCGMVVATGVVTTPARADLWNKKTILTVNETVQVRDTVLGPGQYVLKLFDSQSDRHVVQIFNRDETHIINTVLAIPRERLQPTGHTQFTFWETPPGNVKALRTWFYPGDLIGQEFPYPKHLQLVAMATNTEMAMASNTESSQTEASSNEASSNDEAQAEAAPAEPAPSESAETAAQPEQPAEVAQNDQAPAETPAQSQPAELPRTGSPYPAFGIAGALLLGLAGLLRVRRHA